MKRIGGELIDISIGNRRDPSTLKFYKNVKKHCFISNILFK